MGKVVEQPPRLREESATPPRVDTPMSLDMIHQALRIPSDWPPAEDCNSIAEVPDLRPIQSHPNEDDNNDEIMERPIFSTQEDEVDTPARNTRTRRRTLTKEVIESCMDIMSTPATPRNLESRKLLIKLLCEIAGAVLDGSTGDIFKYRHLRKNPQYRQVRGK